MSEDEPAASVDGANAALPHRELSDPRQLRALSHPVRMGIIDQLLTYGPLTATELGQRLGESASNCSWHLRLLAKHGVVEEAERGTGRQRPWRYVPQAVSVAAESAEPGFATAREALIDTLIARDLESWRAWQQQRASEPEPWRDTGITCQVNYAWLDADEFAEFRRELLEVVDRHLLPRLERIDPEQRPAGARPVRFLALGAPSGPVYQPAEAPESAEPEGE
ncbi:helix-turn-helix transcriptional regulator [Natronosporangium hydrolyticum]|uniref:Helix-turn-helix transcriptional regulator n=1 Tax=Natronosporangium hydrolyticum TaxID=2811111 RepID=A0A895YJG1_9ACTN|nr:helix-turn-helix domain-containing protein [Natronosporangium hydrolyticum]QSB15659.1 helix-turn-helix transcriptional regulator [Natronosporangium hydrolyticum]